MNDEGHRPGPGDFDQSLEDFVRDLKEQFEQPTATDLPHSEPRYPYPESGGVREWCLGFSPFGSSATLPSYYPPREEEGPPFIVPDFLRFRPEDHGFLHPPGWVPDWIEERDGAASASSALAQWMGERRGKGKLAPEGDGEDFSLDELHESLMNSVAELPLPQRDATSSAATSSSGTGSGSASGSGSGSGWGRGSSSNSDSTPKKPKASIFEEIIFGDRIFGDTKEIVDPFEQIYSCKWSDVYYRPSQRSHAHGGGGVESPRRIARDGSGTSSI